jgi:hypothetical protein
MSPRESIIELLSFNPLHTNNVKALMTYLRELLEANGVKQTFPVLNFYCNWSVHSELTASAVAFDLLFTLTRVICEHNANRAASGDLWAQINAAVGISRLRGELVVFLKSLNIPTEKFATDDYWRGFATLLFQKLKEKPLYLTDPQKTRQITELAASLGQADWAVERFQISTLDEYLAWDISCPATREKGIELKGPLGLL